MANGVVQMSGRETVGSVGRYLTDTYPLPGVVFFYSRQAFILKAAGHAYRAAERGRATRPAMPTAAPARPYRLPLSPVFAVPADDCWRRNAD